MTYAVKTMRISEVIKKRRKRKQTYRLSVFTLSERSMAVSYLVEMCCRKRWRKLVFTENNTKTKNHLVCLRGVLPFPNAQVAEVYFFPREEKGPPLTRSNRK